MHEWAYCMHNFCEQRQQPAVAVAAKLNRWGNHWRMAGRMLNETRVWKGNVCGRTMRNGLLLLIHMYIYACCVSEIRTKSSRHTISWLLGDRARASLHLSGQHHNNLHRVSLCWALAYAFGKGVLDAQETHLKLKTSLATDAQKNGHRSIIED